jgi:hypothetical protein
MLPVQTKWILITQLSIGVESPPGRALGTTRIVGARPRRVTMKAARTAPGPPARKKICSKYSALPVATRRVPMPQNHLAPRLAGWAWKDRRSSWLAAAPSVCSHGLGRKPLQKRVCAMRYSHSPANARQRKSCVEARLRATAARVVIGAGGPGGTLL